MKNAFEFRERYDRDGKCTLRERVVGPIVPWCIVAIFLLLAGVITGRALTIPSTFRQLFKL
jgi:hypothetical protein